MHAGGQGFESPQLHHFSDTKWVLRGAPEPSLCPVDSSFDSNSSLVDPLPEHERSVGMAGIVQPVAFEARPAHNLPEGAAESPDTRPGVMVA